MPEQGHRIGAAAMSHAPQRSGRLAAEFRQIILLQLASLDVDECSVRVEIQQVGETDSSAGIYIGLIRLERWDDAASRRLLLSIPKLERRVRKCFQASWISEFSAFAGLWFHASRHLAYPETADVLPPALAAAPRNVSEGRLSIAS